MGVGEIAEEMEILGGQEAAAWTGRRWKERGACVVVLNSFLCSLSFPSLSSLFSISPTFLSLSLYKREGMYVFKKVTMQCITFVRLFPLLSLLPSLS
jgi:hypothetical protein